MTLSKQQPQEQAVTTLGGGCFWCLEAVFEQLRGIEKVVSGYSGGHAPHPSYRQVCDGATGHAEVIQLTFDPGEISYREILAVFFSVHDPTTLNRQGADVGTQYRSIILYHDAEQRAVAEEVIAAFASAAVWGKPIVTELAPYETFYQAEDYHQEYYRQNGAQPYCQVIIEPKLANFRRAFASKIRAKS